MYCKHCGSQLPDGAKFCGNCGASIEVAQIGLDYQTPHGEVKMPTKQKKKLGCLAQVGIAIIVLLIVFIVIIIFGVASDQSSTEGISSAEAEELTAEEAVFPIVLCDDDYLYAELTGIQDYKDMFGNSAQDLETCYLTVSATNRYSGEVTVALDDVSVNDTMTQALSGFPMELLEGKSGKNSFFFSYGNLPISEKEEIENIEFRVILMDETWSEIYRSEVVHIDMK